MKPLRIQLSRRKGFRLPTGVVNCARPGILGNPFPVDVYGRDGAVDLHRRWIIGDMSPREMSGLSRCDRWSDPPNAVSLVSLRAWALEEISAARGKDCACWCALTEKCHADNILELANAMELAAVTP